MFVQKMGRYCHWRGEAVAVMIVKEGCYQGDGD